MGIMVDPNATFAVTVKFRDYFDENGDLTGIRILSDDAEGDDVQVLVCDAVGRDFDSMSRIKEEATIINHVSGEPMLRIGRLCPLIILTFFRGWNACDDDDKETKITPENIGRLHYNVVKALARKWLLKTDGKFRLTPDTTEREAEQIEREL